MTGNGVCDYDFSNGYPKCYCFYGYYGTQCTSNDEDIGIIYEDDELALVGSLIVLTLLLVIVLIIMGYLMLRLSKLGHGYFDRKRKLIKRMIVAGDVDEYEDD